jgi:hypothetical protein
MVSPHAQSVWLRQPVSATCPPPSSACAQEGGESLRPELCLGTALGLFGLEHHEVIWETGRGQDSKCVVAWGGRTILLVYRGTDSLANVLADLKARASAPWNSPLWLSLRSVGKCTGLSCYSLTFWACTR